MSIFDKLFSEEEQEPVDYFPEEVVKAEQVKTERYRKFLSETLSSYYDKPLEETDRTVSLNEEKRLVTGSRDMGVLFDSIYNARLTPDKVQEAVDRYKKNIDLISVLDNPVVSSETVKDPVISDVDKYTRTQAIIDQAAQELAPEEGMVGLISSGIGVIAYGMTGGVAENVLTALETDLGGWDRVSDIRTKFNAIYTEEDPQKALGLARTYMKEWKDLGLFGGNTFRYWQQVQSLKDGAYNENTGFNLALDIAGVVPVTRISKLLPFADDAVSVASAASGTPAANKAMSTALNNSNTATNIAQHSAPAVSRVGNTGLHPSLKPTLENEVHNDYLDTFLSLNRDLYITPEQVKEVGKRYVDELDKRIKNHVSDFKLVSTDKMDNFAIEVMLGKKDGSKFATAVEAQKYGNVLNKELGLGAEVKEVITNNVSDGWVVSYQRNLPLKNFADPINPADLREYGVFNALLSPEVTSAKSLLALKKTGVNKTGAIEAQIFEPLIKVLDKVPRKDIDVIDIVLNDIKLKGTDWLNIDDFKAEYFKLTKKKASEATIEGYKSLYKTQDLVQRINQDIILKGKAREAIQSFRGSFDGQRFYTVKALPKGQITNLMGDKNVPVKNVFDYDTGKLISASDFLKNGKMKTLYKFEDIEDAPVVNGEIINYATGSMKKSKPLTHRDVLKPVAGGYRDSQKLEGYIMQRRFGQDISGNTLSKLPRIIAAGRTSDELKKIANDLNEVFRVYRSNPTDDAMINAVLAMRNGFDPSITTADDLRTFVKNADIDIDKPFEVVNKTDDLPEVGIGNLENYFTGKFKTFDDLYTKGADNSVIYGYGNFQMKQLNPTRVITRDFARSVNYYQGRAYYVNAIEGLIKGAKDHGLLDNLDDLSRKPLYVQIRDAQFKAGKAGDLLRREQKVILQALNEDTDVSLAWERGMKGISDFIFDKTGVETFNITSKDPVTALRAAAFHMKLGFWNPNQVVLQSFHAMNIIAVSPVLGFKAAAAYWPMRAAMATGNDVAIRLAGRRLSGMLGITEDQFVQLARYYQDSGFFYTTANIYENKATMGLSRGVIRNLRESSTFFFKEGERIPRGMATNVAYIEFLRKPGIKLKNGVIDLDDPETNRVFNLFMNNRVEALTFNMTRASAAGWQNGMLGLATQWQSYTAKAVEAMTIGRDFTAAEKARLALTQVLLFGAAGVPFGAWALTTLADEGEIDIPKDTYTFLQGGLLDSMMSQIVGEQTSMSQRVAPSTALESTIEDIFNKNFIDVIGGPSTSILWQTGDLGIKMIYSRFTSEPDVANFDVVKLLREISTFDKGVQAYYIWKLGEYIDKRGETRADGLSPWQGMWNALGVQYQEVTLQWDIQQLLKKEKDAVYSIANRVKELNKVMDGYIDEGDYESANKINNDIMALTAPLDPTERATVRGLTKPSLLTTSEKLLRRDQKNIQSVLGRQLEKIEKE